MIIKARQACEIGREAISGFFCDDTMSQGAAIAFFAVSALSPVLLIL